MQIDLFTASLGARNRDNQKEIAHDFSPIFANKEKDASTEATGWNDVRITGWNDVRIINKRFTNGEETVEIHKTLLQIMDSNSAKICPPSKKKHFKAKN